MDERKTSLFIADRLVLAMEILKTVSMAAENKEYFPENGQNISIALNMAVSELRKCCRVLESILEKQPVRMSQEKKGYGQDGERIVFGKAAENLVEITLVFSKLLYENQGRIPELSDSMEWKLRFMDFANEFEELYGMTDWNSGEHGDYYEEIEKFARGKLLEDS